MYPGLRGCVVEKVEGAESCCLLSVRSGVKATEKSEAWGRGLGAFLAPCSLLPCPARPGGLSTSRGVLCVCVWGIQKEGGLLSLSLWALPPHALSLPPRAPLPECYALEAGRCVWTECWYARRPWGVCWSVAHKKKKACVEGGVLSVFPPGHGFFSSCLPHQPPG